MNETERIRLEEFRQFKKEIRGPAEYLLVGIDVAKDKHHAFFGTAPSERGQSTLNHPPVDQGRVYHRGLPGKRGAS